MSEFATSFSYVPALRRRLLAWYRKHRRDLPWRRTSDPYRIWISEVMLQQTRVAAVLPYYDRFLQRFPDVSALAAAPEPDLLAAWAGLGYYSRARNLQKAAKKILELGKFPRDYESIRGLPGVGDYTAAAVASIAFGLRHAVMDGNVIRVLSRLTGEPGSVDSTGVRKRLAMTAAALLTPKRPGEFNQALMELGATICVARQPQCFACPLASYCEARRLGRQDELPVRAVRWESRIVEKRLLVIEQKGRILVWQRPADSRRLAGFWELPDHEQLPEARIVSTAAGFRHTIVNTNYRFEVARAALAGAPAGFQWLAKEKLIEMPVSTTARKALACLARHEGG